MNDQFDEFSSLSQLHETTVSHGNGSLTPATPTTTARLQYLIENTPAIIYSSVPTGDFKMTFVSSNALRVLGYHPEEMVADPNFWFDHIHPEDIPQIFSSIAMLFTEGSRTYEYRFKSSNDQYIWMHDMLRLIRDAEGNPIEVVGSLTDITQRKQMEEALQKKGEEQQALIQKLQEAQEQLLQSEKMASVGQLAAGIAHEINNPVGFVNSNMGSLQNYVGTLFNVIEQYDKLFQHIPPASEFHQRLAAIREKADLVFLKDDIEDLVRESMDGLKRVKDIVQSLKDFSHVGEADWQEADIHQGLESTLNIVKNEIKYKANIVKEYGKLPPVKCLISQLNQVFMNLFVNASYAIKDSGVIHVSTGVQNDWVWIKVSDTGSGISPENLKHIFEPFFTTKPIGSGTGLGLSLAYGIIKKHRGKIEVESELGKGTSFTIRLPIHPENAPET
ncbi:PAS domain-containing protein [Undibacterium sp. Jales W-56]|uniref:ATP-binding protein n=1 Tax=Undibacterium sp. Jales W-56 TaxID=2897325 RepID=UPI0021D16F53|nr:ATP-binding protein [Undibacterium sp. Jales W-56]MCU6433518.1 PAS domain-containing protein [Undibacterium sp. Jales W-56]